jgi:hypothetical protein
MFDSWRTRAPARGSFSQFALVTAAGHAGTGTLFERTT